MLIMYITRTSNPRRI